MTMHAIVVYTSTVIGGNIATEVTFILNIVCVVFFTESNPELVVRILTVEFAAGTLKLVLVHHPTTTEAPKKEPAPKRVSLSLLLLLLGFQSLNILVGTTCSKTSEVGILASVALIVIEMIHGKLSQIVEILTFRVRETLI